MAWQLEQAVVSHTLDPSLQFVVTRTSQAVKGCLGHGMLQEQKQGTSSPHLMFFNGKFDFNSHCPFGIYSQQPGFLWSTDPEKYNLTFCSCTGLPILQCGEKGDLRTHLGGTTNSDPVHHNSYQSRRNWVPGYTFLTQILDVATTQWWRGSAFYLWAIRAP